MIGSNLLLGEKTVRTGEGGAPNSFGKMGGGKSVGRASRVPPSGFEKAASFCIGALYCTKLAPIFKTNDSEKAPRTGEYASNPKKKKCSLLF